MNIDAFLTHPSFGDVLDAQPYAKSDGPLDDVLQRTGTGGFGGGLLFVCDPVDLEPVFKTWVPNPRNPMVPFARTAFGDIFYAVVPPKGPPSPGILDVHYRTMRPAYAVDLADFFTRVLLDAEYRANELREPTFQGAKSSLGPLSRQDMYAFTPALAIGGSEDGPFDRVNWAVHLDLLFQMTS